MDSIIKAVAKNLSLFKDSLQNEITQKRVDYVNDAAGLVKIRIREHQPDGNSFVLAADGPALLKVEQDTLNILGQRSKDRTGMANAPGAYIQVAYRISFLLNDITKLESFADGTLNAAMVEIKNQWEELKNWSEQNNWRTNLSGFYNQENPALSRRVGEPHFRRKQSIQPYVQVGLQNVNNILTTSTGVGLQLTNKTRPSQTLRYQLFWEPYFFFDKPGNSKFKMRRNDFVTFQFIISTPGYYIDRNEKVEFNQNLSIGYLIHRSGDYFNETTFKVGLPGAKFKFLRLHPEFIFDGLFKNFQPGLKLFLDLD
jgi:hypothetical protein